MKNINRVKALIAIVAIIFGYLVVSDHNPYFNGAIIFFTVLGYICAASWIFDSPTDKEQRTLNKIGEVLN